MLYGTCGHMRMLASASNRMNLSIGPDRCLSNRHIAAKVQAKGMKRGTQAIVASYEQESSHAPSFDFLCVSLGAEKIQGKKVSA